MIKVKGGEIGFRSYLEIFAESLGVHLLLKASDGRVLAGLQVEENEVNLVSEYLTKLGYRYSEITDNIAYKLFLN